MRPAPTVAQGAQGWLPAVLCALCALLVSGCATTPARASLEPTPAASPTLAAASPTSAPPTSAPPTATAPPPAATATPAPTAAPTADPAAPPRVGLQVGHWRIEEHPDEMARLRKFSGAYYRGYDEWEVNIIIAEAVRARLEAAGVVVDLLPAKVPMGYAADAFLSIHVDGVTGPAAETRRGWKVATPFRASQASQGLAEALGAAYAATTGLPVDREEASYNLRAYYAFASYRYWHSIAPTTPAAIIEVGFMTHPDDRALIFDRPDLIADGIARGMLDYLDAYYPLSAAARAPVGQGLLRPAGAGLALREAPGDQRPALVAVSPDARLVPMSERDGWLLVFVQGGDWDLGWVKAAEVVATGEEPLPPHPRPAE